ncbi:membrane protein [Robbsia andropogonis]|uniref:Membrane protein n=1 Tax=Robbsia andropogonis TaxID=28092 RepID=A0A0F5K446_9BURK|nr:DUF802 domain-containing protein [Robbsia andropogonis]KKB64906.1 membrane protein [Robbsia andropogonis]
MSRYRLHYVIFLVGLAVLCWVGVGYLRQGGASPLAFLMTLVITACYAGGAFELDRYRRDSATLAQRVSVLQAAPAGLDEWLAPLPASLRHAVRLRVEGERGSLPGPVLTPYLVGLLVLLGMLGTLLGMVVTLRGTGAAMANATDIDAIRASLGAPIRGLGFAFGTSIAGVAASAMLGLLAALCRRERLQIMHVLDGRIATTLRVFSQRHQRDASLQLLQRQADVMPALVARLEATMAALEQQQLEAQKRQAAQQQTFHAHTERVYLELARSVGESIRRSVADGAQAASAALQPVAQATFDSIGSEMRALQRTVGDAVQHQLAGLTDGFTRSTTEVAKLWQDALQAHTHAGAEQAAQLKDALIHFTHDFETRTREMLDTLSAQYGTSVSDAAQAWRDTVAEQARVGEQLAARHAQSLTDAGAAFTAGAQSLLDGLDTSHTTLRRQLGDQETARLETWRAGLESVTDTLRVQWAHTAAETAQRQQAICDALSTTAKTISEQSAEQARGVIAEMAKLAATASEAPKAAADVIGEMREQLSQSVARDTATLDERARLLDTLQTLLKGVNLAATEQRTAIDTLVGRSSDLLSRIATDFAQRVADETGKLDSIAANINKGASEVASLGETMERAVSQFDAANSTLVTHLERVEGALEKSMSRGDEQLRYYVAQAREVIDLSMLSQKQIIENLQHLAAQRGHDAHVAETGAAAT